MAIWEYLLLIFTVLVGGGLAILLKPKDQKSLQLFLSFSGAYILSICVLEIMPLVFRSSVSNVGIYVLLGFFIQLFLEQFSGGVEHGHIHIPHHQVRKYTFYVMTGLCLHAFMEGLPLGGHQHGHEGHHHHLLWGIILHKAPAAFALVLLLSRTGLKKITVFLLLALFSIMSPLAAFLTYLISNQSFFQDAIFIQLNAVVIGSFLHIATTILFESDGSDHHSVPLPKLLAILVGVGIAMATVLL